MLFVIAALADWRWSFALTLLLFAAIAARWVIDRNDRPSTVCIAPPQGHEGEIEALLDVDGRPWPVGAVREVVVGAIPHPREHLPAAVAAGTPTGDVLPDRVGARRRGSVPAPSARAWTDPNAAAWQRGRRAARALVP
jgi:hypothetical protein